MKIQITQQHIDKGIPGCKENCAIALAYKEQFPEKKISIHNGRIIIDGVEFGFGGIIQQFIRDFDEGKSISPFHVDHEPDHYDYYSTPQGLPTR